MLWYIPPTHPTLNHSGLSKFLLGHLVRLPFCPRMVLFGCGVANSDFSCNLLSIHLQTTFINFGHPHPLHNLFLLLLLSSIHNFHNHPKWKLIPISTNKIANLFLPQVAIGEWCASHHFPLMVVFFFFFDILLVEEGLKEARLLDNPYPQ